MAPLLEARDISKHFGGIAALRAAGFELEAGEIHALMGENGAGKSTLARICAGSHRPDAGEILLQGEIISLDDPRQAQLLGIGIVYQELDLFPHLTVGENLVIGNLHFTEGLLVDRAAINDFARPFLDQVGLAAGSATTVSDLSIAQQQLLVIARALSMQCRILFMDEPTSALSEDAAERLFGVIAQLKAQGVAIVYVSHKMDEIFRLCDRVTVLRDGASIGTRAIAATGRAELIRMMVGRDVDTSSRSTRTEFGPVVLAASGLATHKLQDVSFELHRGEVLGLAGLVGAGRSELGAALFGLHRLKRGSLHVKGRSYAPRAPSDAQRAGLGLVPEDRKREGLMLQMGVRENSTLSVLPRLSRGGFLRAAEERDLFAPVAERLRLKCASPDAAVGSLSGGNQQKALLARWLFVDPDILFLDDPARGIDVAAKEDIYRLIHELAGQGRGILLASSELGELMRCCDRILVLNNGRVAGVFSAKDATQEVIMAAATHAATAFAEAG
ncbi:MAG TPA: sugar ABC transporter ATP-binding protein [Rhizomicrobium sp.]|jgi:ABC-type sugar transport system ATPase subunit|nr:sugar ABC transporter ATP-binding protein [Rhizomicrobium sp.]